MSSSSHIKIEMMRGDRHLHDSNLSATSNVTI